MFGWAYTLGVLTVPVVLGGLYVVLRVVEFFTRTSTGYGCAVCPRWWNKECNGPSWIAHVMSGWHQSTAHPGFYGRSLVGLWRGADWQLERRLNRAFPSPRVTVFDLVARTPVLRGIARSIAKTYGDSRHGTR